MFIMGDAVNPQRIEHALEDPKAPPHHSIALTPGSLSTEKQLSLASAVGGRTGRGRVDLFL